MSTNKNIDARVIRMLTRQGFIDLFWEEFQEKRKENPAVTREEVFDGLNEEYLRVTGMYRYIDYDCFSVSMRKK